MARIIAWSAEQHVLDPTKAELHLRVQLDAAVAGLELRGRLVGPRCCYSSTIEVAYSLLPSAADSEHSSTIHGRIIIPEPSLWDPESPFLYYGRLELWEGGQRCDQWEFRLGLRSIRLGPRGLLLNGRPIVISATKTIPGNDIETVATRSAGFNTLILPIENALTGICNLAAERGLLVLGFVNDNDRTTNLLDAFVQHPCCLGLLLTEAAAANTKVVGDWCRNTCMQRIALIGAEVKGTKPEDIPAQCNFVAGTETALDRFPALPRLLVVDQEPSAASAGNPPVIGWIQQ